MKLLLCLWLSFLSIIPLTEPKPTNEDLHNAFLNSVEEEYQYYDQEWTYEDKLNDISILVIKGIYNNKPAYGISFISYDFNIVLKSLDGYYTINKYDNNQSIIAINSDVTYEILIFSKRGNEYKIPEKITLKKFNINDINKEAFNLGNNNFKQFDKLLTYSFKLPFYMTLIMVFVSVISISLIGILILFITKKGFFDKKKRKEGILDIKSILEADTDDKAREDLFKDISTDVEVISENKENFKEESKDSSNVQEITDIKEYLQSLGYVTDYHILSEEEKNKIMLELMKLKDNKEISLKKYYEETYQLWKK